MRPYPSCHLGDLPIGGRQLVDLGRAIGREPRLFILDEPSATRNAADIAYIFAAVRWVAASGCDSLYVSHRLEEDLMVCDRVGIMRDEAVIAVALVADLSQDRLVSLVSGPAPEPPCRNGAVRSAEIVLDLAVRSAGRVWTALT
ncbi:sugar ABC transporter ATP-binding protein [Paracoccus aminophilus]|uniref:hypothetical protein n=1 Tax=Paracoccus aminophilus TaxID=34003 RepID=UPI00059FB4E9|nr:hypothetical protein [Paracoccus aminophilus]